MSAFSLPLTRMNRASGKRRAYLHGEKNTTQSQHDQMQIYQVDMKERDSMVCGFSRVFPGFSNSLLVDGFEFLARLAEGEPDLGR